MFYTPHRVLTHADLPEGELILVGPTDAAFTNVLKQLKTDPAALISNPAIVGDLLKNHIAVATGPDALTATALNGDEIHFVVDGKDVALSAVTTAAAGGSAMLMDAGKLDNPAIAAAVSCPGQTAFVVDKVLIPTAYESEIAPVAIAPGMAPGMAPMAGPAAPLTLGAVVDSLCPAILEALDRHPILGAAVAAVADTPVTIPAGMQVLLAAPSDAAFTAVLQKLGITAEQLLADKATLLDVLTQHIGVFATDAATTATAMSNDTLSFMLNGAAASVAAIDAAIKAGPTDATVMDSDSLESPTIDGVTICEDLGQHLIEIDEVILPKAVEDMIMAAAAPAIAPVVEELPALAPASAATSATFGAAAAVAAAVALLA